MTGKRILIISNSTIERDPRVYRQIVALQDDWEVDVIGNGEIKTLRCKKLADFVVPLLAPLKEEGFFEYRARIRGRLNLVAACIAYIAASAHAAGGRAGKLSGVLEARMYWQYGNLKRLLKGKQYNLVIGNDFHALPLMFALPDGTAGRIYDAHEYAPGQFRSGVFGLIRRLYTLAILHQYLGRCDAVMTVSEGIADLHEKTFKVRPLIAWNGPIHSELEPGRVDPEHIKMVHSGLIDPKRKIEKMIELMSLLDHRFELHLYLVGDRNSDYFKSLHALGLKTGRVFFPDPVPMISLVRVLNSYDIGLTLLKPETVNHLYGLPNKFFDFIQARLAVASWPRIEIRKLVDWYGIGICSEDFTIESMATILNQMSPEAIMGMKNASQLAARELSSEKATELIRTLARTHAK